MPERAPQRPRIPPPALLAAGDEFDGLVVLPEAARIDGRVVGRVLGVDLVWIGAGASLRARVEAREVVVEGRIEGGVAATERVELLAGARVRGSLRSAALAVADGSVLEGRCRAGDPRVGLNFALSM